MPNANLLILNDWTCWHSSCDKDSGGKQVSKFDRADPSLNREYADGLNVEDPLPGPTCYWCGDAVPTDLDIYCSALCANYALTDDCER